ncbi:toll-like receptor 2 [Engraulis encrasicolus]|uniref:toll-like receptor 2 n=1 Tax=Engraulis encrasicolus TaxID=184585 RepID=UPI002FCEDD28
MFVLLVLLILCWDQNDGSPQTKEKCNRCVCDETFACDCSSLNLQEVPAISASTKSLDLSFNKIKTIGEDDFGGCTHLQILILRSNVISSIAEKGFSTLCNLEVLDLSNNQLNSLSATWFKRLSSLKHLNLLGNGYRTLGREPLFDSMTSLSTLMIGNQFLDSVNENTFIGMNHSCVSFVFNGSNLMHYQPGSFSQITCINEVTVSINGTFHRNMTLTAEILQDLSRPETKLILSDLTIARELLVPFGDIFGRGLRKILLRNLICSTDTILSLFWMTQHSKLTFIGLEDCEFYGNPYQAIYFPNLDFVTEIYINNVKLDEFYNFPAFHGFIPLQKLLMTVKRIALIDSNVFAMPWQTSVFLCKVEYMDLSKNQLTDLTLREALCYQKTFIPLPSIKTFNISSNYIRSFDHILIDLINRMKQLTALDMSLNVFHSMPLCNCTWPQALRYLNLSSCQLRKVTACLPATLHVLDLSNNDLTTFDLSNMTHLKELHLSGNRLRAIPGGMHFAHLEVLLVKGNPFPSFDSKQLSNYSSLRAVEAGTDTYVCSCEFVYFFKYELHHLNFSLKDRRQTYICDSPFAMRGKAVDAAKLSVFECQAPLTFSILCATVLVLVIGGMVLCHKLHVIWYVQMTWAWVQAKRRPVPSKDQVCYDAFVSYSEMDAEWVEELLVPQLEGAEPPFRLCLHKRDFLPGGWIADSIMAAIEKSHRTLFIVSQHFVQSDWCRYELDYSHFRLFDAGSDAAILILLEPIPDSTIPKRFCKLRKVMNSRTYLEWPEEDSDKPRFWQSLRDTLCSR